MIDVGTGPPLVLVPGLQGRWEWMRPTVAALSRHFRVLTFTLADEPTSGHAFDPALGFDNYLAQIDRVLDHAGVQRAAVCGISYGGLIALRYAALRPGRVGELVLVSALAPGYEPDDRARFYSRAPRLLFPLFCVGACQRAWVEVARALPAWHARLRFGIRQLWTLLGAPMSPPLMRQRIALLRGINFFESARAIAVPTLVVTGDAALDRVVPVEHTLRYRQLLTDVEAVQLTDTGHNGVITRPVAFADLVADFVRRVGRRAASPQRVAG
jgi:pimeloyl-ACP methyl ester carboxylesterase